MIQRALTQEACGLTRVNPFYQNQPMSEKSSFVGLNGTTRTSYGSTRGQYPPAADRQGAIEHELEPGDNLARLSLKYGVTVSRRRCRYGRGDELVLRRKSERPVLIRGIVWGEFETN